MQLLSIGKLAKLAEISTVTIRYYERIGLIPKAERSTNGYRSYPADTIMQLRFIKNAKSAGFALSEIGKLQILQRNDELSAKEVRLFIIKKINELRDKINALHDIKQALEKLVTSCDGTSAMKHCPILESFRNE